MNLIIRYLQINTTDANLLITGFLFFFSFSENSTLPFHHCFFPDPSYASIS